MSKTEQPFHFYATTCFGWGRGDTLDEAIKIANSSTPAPAVARFLVIHEGVPVQSCKVLAPRSARYDINGYMPQEVPTADYSTHRIVSAKGDYITLTSPADLRGRLARIQMEAEQLGYSVSYTEPPREENV